LRRRKSSVGNGAPTGLHHPRHDSGNAAGAPALQATMPTDRRQRTGASVVISAKVNKLGSSIDG